MQALYLADGQLSYRTDYPLPKREAHEAFIRVVLAGICATDLEMVKGYVPDFRGVLGHEFVGIVEAAPDPEWHGRRVVGRINLGCGQCEWCRRDIPEHCSDRQALGIHNRDGVFADYVTLPADNLLAVPDAVSDEAAVFTEPLAAALRIREQVDVIPATKTAVVGPGRLGMLVAQVLALAGADVTLIGRRQQTLDLPAALGFSTALVNSLPDNHFDLVVEATGNEAGFVHALRLVRPLGTLVLKSTYAHSSHIDLTKVVVDEITIVGSRCGPFATALPLLAQNRVNVDVLLDAEYPLADGRQAFAHAARSGARKVVLRP